LAAFISFATLSYFFYGRGGSLTAATVGGGGDTWSFVWVLQWWPWALTHGENPFVTGLIWFPTAVNLAWATVIPTLALLAWPVTWLAGPIVSFNLLTLLAPAMAAWTAFLLARRISHSPAAAWVCGFMFGFSSYETGHLQGHLNLDTICLVPLLIHLPLRRLAGEISAWRHIAALAAVLLLQFGISTEVFATCCFFGAMTWLVFVLCAPAADRQPLRRLAGEVVVAALLTAVLASPYLYYVAVGLPALPETINSPITYSANLLNFVVPTPLTWLGGEALRPVSARFSGNPAEQGAYFGLPLLAMAVLYYCQRPRRLSLALLLLTVCLVVASLGPALWWNGTVFSARLPWHFAETLPLLRSALPGRFVMYASLALGLAVSLWLAQPPNRAWWRFGLAGLACLALAPRPITTGWIVPPPPPVLPHGGSVVALTLPFGPGGPGMIWQAQAGFRFALTAGYLGFPPPAEDESVLSSLQTGVAEPDFLPRFQAYAMRHHVTVVVVAPGTPPSLVQALDDTGWARVVQGQTTIFTVPDLAGTPVYSIRGEYWPDQDGGWLGRQAQVDTRGQAVRIQLTAARPDGAITAIDVDIDGMSSAYRLQPGQSAGFDVPANATVRLRASPVFQPDLYFHNKDDRGLSVRMTVERRP
jgi:hypothetical protein